MNSFYRLLLSMYQSLTGTVINLATIYQLNIGNLSILSIHYKVLHLHCDINYELPRHYWSQLSRSIVWRPNSTDLVLFEVCSHSPALVIGQCVTILLEQSVDAWNASVPAVLQVLQCQSPNTHQHTHHLTTVTLYSALQVTLCYLWHSTN